MLIVPSTDYKGLTLLRALNALSSERPSYAEACFVLLGAAAAIGNAGISKPTITGDDEGSILLAWDRRSLSFMLWVDFCDDEFFVSWAAHTGSGECKEKAHPPQAPLPELLTDLRRFLRTGASVEQKLLKDPLPFDVRDLTAKRDTTEYIITSERSTEKQPASA